MSQVVDSSSHSVILGKERVRKLILGKHLFNIAQGDKKKVFRIIIASVDEPKYYRELCLRGEM